MLILPKPGQWDVLQAVNCQHVPIKFLLFFYFCSTNCSKFRFTDAELKLDISGYIWVNGVLLDPEVPLCLDSFSGQREKHFYISHEFIQKSPIQI
jgi:hypothetical protein